MVDDGKRRRKKTHTQIQNNTKCIEIFMYMNRNVIVTPTESPFNRIICRRFALTFQNAYSMAFKRYPHRTFQLFTSSSENIEISYSNWYHLVDSTGTTDLGNLIFQTSFYRLPFELKDLDAYSRHVLMFQEFCHVYFIQWQTTCYHLLKSIWLNKALCFCRNQFVCFHMKSSLALRNCDTKIRNLRDSYCLLKVTFKKNFFRQFRSNASNSVE